MVIQSLEPYVSSEDINKGARWSIDIAKELEESSFGIICITHDNLDAPWLNFEAGALSKSFDSARVSPFLYNLKPSDMTGSPLLQFQSTSNEREDILRLVLSINSSCGAEKLDEDKLRKTFDVWYEKLEERFKLIGQGVGEDTKTVAVDSNKQEMILEELLELSRNQQKILNNPTHVLPPTYLLEIFELSNRSSVRDKKFYFLMNEVYHELKNGRGRLEIEADLSVAHEVITRALERMDDLIRNYEVTSKERTRASLFRGDNGVS